ncbi:MAG: hypothetical protein ABSG57_13070 [Candidatus Bathyarchaeia archaeon]
MERSQQQLSEAMIKAMPYYKWFTTGKSHTRKRNAQLFRQFCEWLGKKPEELRAEYVEARKSVDTLDDWRRETKNTLMQFYTWLKEEKHFKTNYCRTVTTSTLAFYSQNCERILGVTREFDPIQIPENEFVFNQEILRKCYYYGSPFEKAWLSVAVSLGYSSQDFLDLETERISNLVRQAKDEHLDFIGFIGKTRQKTSVQPRSFLTPEAISNLADYLETLRKKGDLPKTLWNKADNDNLNDWLKALLRRANIETYGKQVHFHTLRKFLYDTLSKKDETIAKVVTAKKTSASDLTYKTSLDSECTRIFRECYKEFALNGDVSGKAKREQSEKIESLELALLESQKRVTALETTNETLRTRITQLESGQNSMGRMMVDFKERIEWLENKAKKKAKVQWDSEMKP